MGWLKDNIIDHIDWRNL